MDDTDKFIELVTNVCYRPKMFTLNGTFGEVAAIFTGIEIGGANSPIGHDQHCTLNSFVTSRLHVPDKFWWPGAVRLVAADDEAAIRQLAELLTEYAILRRTNSLEAIRKLAAKKASEYSEAEPAKVWRRFLAARYTADETQISPLIMPHPDAAFCGMAIQRRLMWLHNSTQSRMITLYRLWLGPSNQAM